MVDFHYPFICIICLIALFLICIQYAKSILIYKENKYFSILVIGTIIYCMIDLWWGFSASGITGGPQVLFAVSTLNLIFAGIIAYLFFLYIFSFCKTTVKYPAVVFSIALIVVAVGVLPVILNCFDHSLFMIDELGNYVRTDVVRVRQVYVIHMLYYVAAFCFSIYTFYSAKHNDQRISKSVLLFPLIPLLAGILQSTTPYYPFFSLSYTFVCFTIFIFQLEKEHSVLLENSVKSKVKSVLDECIDVLNERRNPESNITTLLELLSNYYGANGVYLTEFAADNLKVETTYSWCNDSEPLPIAEKINSLPDAIVLEWYNIFKARGAIYVADASSNMVIPSYVQYCKSLNIKNSLAVPVYSGGKIAAIISIYNFTKYKHDYTIANTMAFFLLSEINKNKFFENNQKTNDDIIKALASEYGSVYYINLDEDTVNICRQHEKIDSLFKNSMNENLPFTPTYKFYIDSLLKNEDKEEMLEFGQIEVLKAVLSGRKNVCKKFKSDASGTSQFYEAKWVKVEGEDCEPHNVILGIANIDEKVKQHDEEVRQREMQQAQLNSIIEKAEEASRESQFDKLTGVYNKASGLEIMSKYLKAKENDDSYALIFIDLDKFKDINDTFGHLEGDNLLQSVGKAISSKTRAGDICVRFGGDEFVIIFKGINDTQIASKKADAIADEIRRSAYGKEYQVTCSIGGYVTTSRSLEDTLDNADKALYQVKNNGRDGVKILKD